MGTGLRGGDLRKLLANRARKITSGAPEPPAKEINGVGGTQGSLPESQRRAKHRRRAALRNPGGVSAMLTMLRRSCPMRSGTGAHRPLPPLHSASVLNAPRRGELRISRAEIEPGESFLLREMLPAPGNGLVASRADCPGRCPPPAGSPHPHGSSGVLMGRSD